MKILIKAFTVLVLCCTLFNNKSIGQETIIKFDFSKSGYVPDSLFFCFSDDEFMFQTNKRYRADTMDQVVPVKDKIAIYNLKIKKHGFVNIGLSIYGRLGVENGQPLMAKADKRLARYYIEPGDNVKIVNVEEDLTNGENSARRFSFYGKGSEKFTCKMKIDSIIYNTINTNPSSTKTGVQQILGTYKNQISNQAFEQLSIYAYSTITKHNIEVMLINSKRFKTIADSTLTELKKIIKADSIVMSIYKAESKHFSPMYCEVDLLKRYSIASLIGGDVESIYDLFYNNLKKESNLSYRDKLIGAFFWQHASRIKTRLSSFASDALKIIENKSVRNYVQGYLNLSVGKPFYKFSLPNINNKKISLEDLKGKVVFVDFWFTGCTACSGYYKDVLSKVEQHFRNDPAVVFITISTDNDLAMWRNSVVSEKYTSSDAINLYTDGFGHDHPLMNWLGLKSAPIPMLLDKNLNILDMSNQLRGHEYLVKRIEEAKDLSK